MNPVRCQGDGQHDIRSVTILLTEQLPLLLQREAIHTRVARDGTSFTYYIPGGKGKTPLIILSSVTPGTENQGH